MQEHGCNIGEDKKDSIKDSSTKDKQQTKTSDESQATSTCKICAR